MSLSWPNLWEILRCSSQLGPDIDTVASHHSAVGKDGYPDKLPLANGRSSLPYPAVHRCTVYMDLTEWKILYKGLADWNTFHYQQIQTYSIAGQLVNVI